MLTLGLELLEVVECVEARSKVMIRTGGKIDLLHHCVLHESQKRLGTANDGGD